MTRSWIDIVSWIYPEVGRSALNTVDPDSDGAIARARRQEVARRREGHAHDRLRVATKSKRQQQWVNVNCGDFLIQLTKLSSKFIVIIWFAHGKLTKPSLMI